MQSGNYFTEPEISRLLKILSPLDKSTLEELLIDPKERAAKRAKTAAERKEFMDFWSAESLEKHLQNPDVNISALAKIECYLYKALDDRMGTSPSAKTIILCIQKQRGM